MASVTAARLKGPFSKLLIFRCHKKNKPLLLPALMIVYQFRFTYGPTYLAGTTQYLPNPTKAHQPRWLELEGRGGPSFNWYLSLRLRPHSGLLKGRWRTLPANKTLSVHPLCSQARLVQVLEVPWPRVTDVTRSPTSTTDGLASWSAALFGWLTIWVTTWETVWKIHQLKSLFVGLLLSS